MGRCAFQKWERFTATYKQEKNGHCTEQSNSELEGGGLEPSSVCLQRLRFQSLQPQQWTTSECVRNTESQAPLRTAESESAFEKGLQVPCVYIRHRLAMSFFYTIRMSYKCFLITCPLKIVSLILHIEFVKLHTSFAKLLRVFWEDTSNYSMSLSSFLMF